MPEQWSFPKAEAGQTWRSCELLPTLIGRTDGAGGFFPGVFMNEQQRRRRACSGA
jgi:hypothetical protein